MEQYNNQREVGFGAFPALLSDAKSAQTRKIVMSWKMPRVMNWKNQCRPRIVLLHLGRGVAWSPRVIGMVGYVLERVLPFLAVAKMIARGRTGWRLICQEQLMERVTRDV